MYLYAFFLRKEIYCLRFFFLSKRKQENGNIKSPQNAPLKVEILLEITFSNFDNSRNSFSVLENI